MRNFQFITAALALVVGFGLNLSTAEARQYKKMVNGREVVVHTNPIPVVLHRMVPPQHGRHVTQREIAGGSAPSGRAVSQRSK
ncbi:hypothetical protein VN12_12180 [Pirellula sp. SH-Sr6A]|uniref:hypothetical protein n=1 Tax=Pirellula sp. SH-Sr6A TaxID=1632865 RepID=UPI00078E3D52|nr:hypothetical protein [Pirellula sp. SH-Sr6A]AMV32876.1 hypothetical protein VN12_12180 [Pirellula sp. SH-Sr6A]